MSRFRVSAAVSAWPARVAPLLGCVAVRVRALVSALAALALALVSALPALVLRVLLRVLWRRLPARVRLSCRRCCAPASGCVLFLVLRPLRRVRLPSPRCRCVVWLPVIGASASGAAWSGFRRLLRARCCCWWCWCVPRSARVGLVFDCVLCCAVWACVPCGFVVFAVLCWFGVWGLGLGVWGLGFGIWGRRARPACRVAPLSRFPPACAARRRARAALSSVLLLFLRGGGARPRV